MESSTVGFGSLCRSMFCLLGVVPHSCFKETRAALFVVDNVFLIRPDRFEAGYCRIERCGRYLELGGLAQTVGNVSKATLVEPLSRLKRRRLSPGYLIPVTIWI